MPLTRKAILADVGAELFAKGEALVVQGAVRSARLQRNCVAGTLETQGYAPRVVVVRVFDNHFEPECTCARAQSGKLCEHSVAVLLRYLKEHPVADDEVIFDHKVAMTQKQIQAWCGDKVYARALQLYQDGAVYSAEYKHPIVLGIVILPRGELKVSFKILSPEHIDVDCPCYLASEHGQVCEHVMALAIYIMMRETNPERKLKHEEELRTLRKLQQVDPRSLIQRRPSGGTPADVLLVFPQDFVSAFHQGSVPVGVRISFGGKAYLPEQVPRTQVFTFPPRTDDLLSLFEDVSVGPFPAKMKLGRVDFMSLLRCATSARIFLPDKQRITFNPHSQACKLQLTLDEATGDLLLAVVGELPGRFLVAHRIGFLLAGGELYPLQKLLPEPYHAIYAEPIRIPRDGILTFLKSELVQIQQFLPLSDESLTPDLFTETPGHPVFHLHLSGSPVSIRAELNATYGKVSVPVASSDAQHRAEPDPDDYYHFFTRNLPKERTALKDLAGYGFHGPNGATLAPVVGDYQVLNFLATGLTAARRNGWKVTCAGSIAPFFEDAEVIVPLVNIKTLRSGDFEVTFSYESTRDNIPISAAEVQRAVLCGESFLKKEGKTILIDSASVQAMLDIFKDIPAVATDTPGGSRIPAVYAPYVQAALSQTEGIDFEDPPDWRERASRQNRALQPQPVPLGPLEGTLRPYQKEGVYWLRFLENGGFAGILADEMGLGKTLQTLTWISLQRVKDATPKRPALIICPTSLVENWSREAEKFVPHLRCLVLSGSNRHEHFAELASADIVVTSYALIRRDIDLYAKEPFSIAVLDEAQAIKNKSTQNAIAVKQIHAESKLVLSGTPIENGVSDLWSIMDFLMPGYLGGYEEFKLNYETMIELGGRDAEIAQEKLRRKLHPFLLRRLKRDVAKDLPPKIIKTSFCKLTPAQQSLYDRVANETRTQMKDLVKEKGFNGSRMEILALLMRLRQISCDLRLIKDRTPSPKDGPSAKVEAFLELLDEARAGGHRMLVFSQFTSMLKLLAQELQTRGLKYCYLDGATKNRLEQCATFNQSPDIPVFLISLKAGGTGLNLTGADIVLHFDPWWNPAAEDQATDRAHRIGQKKTVYAIKLIAENTIEERVLKLQERKQQLIQATVGTADDTIATSLTWQEIQTLV